MILCANKPRYHSDPDVVKSSTTHHITIKPTSAAVHASVSAVAQAEPVIGANTLIGQVLL